MDLDERLIEETEAYGFRFKVLSGDTGVGRCLRQYGEFGRIGSTICAQLAAGRAFIDVGANVGAYTLPVAQTARQVIAIEPQPAIAQLLRDNVTANGLANITVLEAAAAAVAGEMDFPTPNPAAQINFGGVGAQFRSATARVPALRLDDIAPADTAIVKIDVEGAEGAVLAGADDLLAQGTAYWIAEVNRDTPETRDVIECFRREHLVYWFFDPFVTPRCARGVYDGSERGDISVFAAPVAGRQPVGMVEIGPTYDWPTSLVGFSYLGRFGLALS